MISIQSIWTGCVCIGRKMRTEPTGPLDASITLISCQSPGGTTNGTDLISASGVL